MNEETRHIERGLPLDKLAAPARRALASAGITRLEDLTVMTEDELQALHGIGPKALAALRDALDARGMAFAE